MTSTPSTLLASTAALIEYATRHREDEQGRTGWGHRRPDITALHPSTGVKHVFDVMIRWATTQTAGQEAGAGAAWAEAYKVKRYVDALRRLDDAEDALALLEGRAPNYTRRDVFVPLAFEGGVRGARRQRTYC